MGTMAVGGDLGWWGPEGALGAMWYVFHLHTYIPTPHGSALMLDRRHLSDEWSWLVADCLFIGTWWGLPLSGPEQATFTPRMPSRSSPPARPNDDSAYGFLTGTGCLNNNSTEPVSRGRFVQVDRHD